MVPKVELNDGTSIPQLGFGVYKIEPDRTAAAIADRAGGGLPPRQTQRRCAATT